jgi:hypothetical protein
MKATAEEYAFHQRICARDDPIAFAQLAEQLYSPLVQDVYKRAGYSHPLDPVLVEEAVGRALLDYRDQPQRYDPQRMSLHGYLAMAAFRDYQNAQARERRIMNRQVSLFDLSVQEQDFAEVWNLFDEGFNVDDIWKFIDETFPDPVERQMVELIINRERSIEPYARLLRLDGLSDDERQGQVQQVKYRIAKRLRRQIRRRFLS